MNQTWWASISPYEQNDWLYTHILRRPLLCPGKRFTPLAITTNYPRQDRSYGCLDCGEEIIVGRSFYRFYEENAIYGIVARPHRRTQLKVPNYVGDRVEAYRLLRFLADRGEGDELFASFAKILLEDVNGLAEDEIFPTFRMLCFVQPWSPGQICAAVWRAYEGLHCQREAALAASRILNADIAYRRLVREMREDGVPLFVRVGEPQPIYAERDLPYVELWGSIRDLFGVQVYFAASTAEREIHQMRDVLLHSSRLAVRDIGWPELIQRAGHWYRAFRCEIALHG